MAPKSVAHVAFQFVVVAKTFLGGRWHCYCAGRRPTQAQIKGYFLSRLAAPSTGRPVTNRHLLGSTVRPERNSVVFSVVISRPPFDPPATIIAVHLFSTFSRGNVQIESRHRRQPSDRNQKCARLICSRSHYCHRHRQYPLPPAATPSFPSQNGWPRPLASLMKLYGTFWPTNNLKLSTIVKAATSAAP